MSNKKFKIMIMALMAYGLCSFSNVATKPSVAAAFYAGTSKTELLQKPLVINGGSQRVIMKLRNMDVKNLLKLLATKAGFNILFDDTVTGQISVDLNNVTINQALETVKDYANLIYMQDNSTLVVAGKDSGLAKSINQQVTQFIPVKYINAKLVASLLNSTIFGDSSNKASTEFRTNSVVIVGTNNDIRLAEDTISKIDIPRQTQIFKINNTDVLYITQLLQATIFNDGINPYNNQSGAAASGALATKSSPLTVITETYEEGSTNSVTGASTGSSASGNSQAQTLKTKKLAMKDINISPDGPIIIPDTRSSTLTIMGTSEQIQLAASIIPTLDEKLPQVAIETSLIDLSDESFKELEAIWGQSSGQWATGYRSSPDGSVVSKTATPPFGITNLIGLPSPLKTAGTGPTGLLAFSTTPLTRSTEFLYKLNALVKNGKARLLANPTVVALHNSESVINITEEIIKKSTTTLTLSSSSATAQVEAEIGEAGIFLNILPQVTRDGYINLKIHPLVSSPYDTKLIGNQGGFAVLLRKRDFSAQTVRVANGQTLALGGLIQEESEAEKEVVPGLGDLPLIGPLFSFNHKEHSRREVLMLMTPRILTDANQKIVSSFDTKPLVDVFKNKTHKLITPQEETSKENN